MTPEELKILQICKDRNELDFLYNITKIIAETDSIGEGYGGYCYDYSKESFEKGMHDDDYLLYAGLPIYILYLKQIKIIPVITNPENWVYVDEKIAESK